MKNITNVIYDVLEKNAAGRFTFGVKEMSDKVAAAIAMHEHYLFAVISKLVEEHFYIQVFSEGEVDPDTPEPSNCVATIFEATQAYDEAVLVCTFETTQVFHYQGQVYISNCNEPDESVCDYTLNSVRNMGKLWVERKTIDDVLEPFDYEDYISKFRTR